MKFNKIIYYIILLMNINNYVDITNLQFFGGSKIPNILDKHKSYFINTNGVIGFYYPGHDDPIDKKCNTGFLGNFYKCNKKIIVKDNNNNIIKVNNTEAYFQAKKFTHKSHIFKLFNNATGEQSFQIKKKYPNDTNKNFYKLRKLHSYFTNIPTLGYLSLPGSIVTMFEGLYQKFFSNNDLKNLLLNTYNAFLLEHNSTIGRDKIWSNNNDGSGSNILGLLLMIIRIIIQYNHSNFHNIFIQNSLINVLQNVSADDKNLYKSGWTDNYHWQYAIISSTKLCVNSINSYSSPTSPTDYYGKSHPTPLYNLTIHDIDRDKYFKNIVQQLKSDYLNNSGISYIKKSHGNHRYKIVFNKNLSIYLLNDYNKRFRLDYFLNNHDGYKTLYYK